MPPDPDETPSAKSRAPVLHVGAHEAQLAACLADLRAGARVALLAQTASEAGAALVAAPIHSPQERARAARFVRPVDAAQHLLGRALVRRIAGALAGIPPTEVELLAEPSGKPRIGHSHLEVSISHSGGWVACAFSPSGRIGVDVEVAETGRPVAVAELAPVVLAAGERAFLEALPEAARANAFLDLWRRKEAVLKATGHGLARDPAGLSMLCPDGRLAQHVEADGALFAIAELSAPGAAPVAVAWEEEARSAVPAHGGPSGAR